jgi:DNA-binding SARP family transcriptional activator/class 3 adenylate cyclase
MEFRILGPLEVGGDGGAVALPRGKQRALLALLLLEANQSVAATRIVDDLWGAAVPETAAKMIQVYVSRLRRALPEERLETRGASYVLRVEPGELDLERFEALAAEGRRALSENDPDTAARQLREALSLWRGSALAEFDEPFARGESARIEELRLAALEERVEADLALGRHAEVTAELEGLVERHPLRERLRRQLLVALYRSGRQAEALAAYRDYRRLLADELGIEPSPDLRELEARILRHDPQLAPGAAPVVPVPAAQPDVHHARSGDLSIAYQVLGEGPLDLVLVHGWICSFQPGWEYPPIAHFYRRLASLGRLILFDKRGTGLSDRVSPDRLPDLETRMDDVRAVMDEAGSERAVVLGISEGCAMSMLFASTYPERTVALGLMSGFARRLWAPDYPIGEPEEQVNRRIAIAEHGDWARATALEWLGRVAPSATRDEATVRWYTSYVARGGSPGAIRALRLMNNQIDVRQVLSAIHVPTLVLHRTGEFQPYRDGSTWLAERIPGAKLVLLPGSDHLPWEGDQDGLLDELEGFVHDVRDEAELDRVLATILFTDLVGSTAKAAELGDRAWRELLDRYHALVRGQLARYRGREVDTAGDGVFATFDGPARAIRCAGAIVQGVRSLGIEVRAGLHTGEVELANGGVRGIAVHIGARVASRAGPGEVLVSHTVRDLVAGSGLEFDDRGEHELAGVPGEWRLAALRPA